MRPVRSSALVALALTTALGATACGGGSSASGGKPVDGRTFNLALAADPGSLDPQLNISSGTFQLTQFAYDPLVSIDDKGQIHSELATKWNASGTTVTFDIGSGITCADGSTFDARTAADNISWVEDPKNKSPFLGVFVPAGAKATASGSTVTVKLAAPAPFALSGFANFPMVCEHGLKDRGSLKDKTDGTGPYQLTSAAPGSSYSYKLRDGYTWGPDGATTKTTGIPAQIEVKVVANETTAANELLSGQTNSAQILGPDAKRLAAAGLEAISVPSLNGEQWYNHGAGHATSDPVVRKALTQALDLGQLAKVITSGTGGPATSLAETPPTGCTDNTVEGNLPATDPSAAASELASAGWTKGSDGILTKGGKKLAITFIYDSTLGTGGNGAAELAAKAWKDLGADVSEKAEPTAQMQAAMFGSGDWDVAWEPINVNTPDQLVPFLSGPGVAAGGNNFSGIDNAAYTAAVKKAMTENGAASCPEWKTAEAALFKDADVVPFASQLFKSFAKGATYDVVGEIVPTSIRMLG